MEYTQKTGLFNLHYTGAENPHNIDAHLNFLYPLLFLKKRFKLVFEEKRK